MRVLSFLFIMIILYSCSGENKKTSIEKIKAPRQTKTEKKISIKKIGELRFRRSYADNQFREMSHAEYEEIRRSNPEPDYFNDSLLVKKFQKIGLINSKKELLLRKFNSFKVYDYEHPEALFILEDSSQMKLSSELCKINGVNEFNLWVSDGTKAQEIKIDGFYFEGLKYMLLDIIKGGYKEVVILNNYYIMNGDNSDLFIYEINYN